MPTSPKTKNKGKIKTPTPLAEAGEAGGGGGSRRSSISSSEENIIVHHHQFEDTGSEDQREDENIVDEQEGLLGQRSTAFNPMIVDDGKRKKGRIKILGVSLPKSLLYLISIPPILLLLSFFSSISITPLPKHLPTISNGTHSFYPTVLLISLDGFRPEYLKSHSDLLSNLIELSKSDIGIKAESMKPVFPTLTFPNHWSLMTGLHPESHGIIANNFYDPLFERASSTEEDLDGDEEERNNKKGAQFVYTEEDKSWNGNWWWGEPIWSVVERVKRKSAVIMWPGPPITSSGISPSYFVPYRKLLPSEKLNQIFSYLDHHPIEDRPEFIASYFPEIDQSGHRGGPNSLGVNTSLALCDEMIGKLRKGLKDRNLENIVNVIIVSDHGMAETSNDRIIYLDDILGEEGVDAIEHKDGWPSVGLRFKEGTDTEYYLNILLDAAKSSNGTFAVYTHETMPERWHFSHGHRIAPIYVVPTIGWAISDHHEHEVLFQGEYQPKGNHGYDNIFPEMQAIFFGQGPFVNLIKEKASSEVFVSQNPPILKDFPNLEVFSLVTRLLGLSNVEPLHNGTLRFWNNYLGAD
ncbi:uncharacterized protein L201_003129 [Kwoniella dendrophila CBS 6074]|uniref:Type I phosphodiesterase/nucleotide pyrophosphatase n=1 Tax=Kwoniella dendrophila CBS 6074 TaxID=1295534 RepID=A0AAX4JTS9_9TREE